MDIADHTDGIDPRRRFFNEDGDSIPPFVLHDWRGGVLDPDRLKHAKIPRFLFESIILAVQCKEVFLQTYSPGHGSPFRIESSWASFRAHRFEQGNWSLEYVLYDATGRWAVLLEPEAIVVGADRALADKIDALLDDHGTSLQDLTHQSFPGLEPSNPKHRYYFEVLGAQGSSGAP